MTTTDLGARANAGKPRYDLIPADALRALAWVYTLGAIKYDDRNWERGLSWSDTLSSLMRHAEAIKAGEDYDAETRLPHAAHIAWNGMALTSMLLRGIGVDDRALKLDAQFDALDTAARTALRTIENAMPLPKATMPFSPPKPADETVSVVDLDEAAAQRELERAIAQAAADRVSAAGGSEQ